MNNKPSSKLFPLTILSVSREEFTKQPLQLIVKDGKTGEPTQLPEDLQGHVFILSPAGSLTSAKVEEDTTQQVVWSSKDGWTPLYNGDGMIYRLSFQKGGANLKTRLVTPPCYYADLATADVKNKDKYGDLAFQDLGISRVSFNKLGARNQLNTAFVAFRSAEDSSDRLLVTWDVGRPHEIDPKTLATLAPVGKNQDWEDMLPAEISPPFKQIMTSAHPCFDPYTNRVFTVNVGKSLWTMLGLSRSLKQRLAENAASLKIPLKKSSFSPDIRRNLLSVYSGLLKILQFLVQIIEWVEKVSQRFAKHNFVRLLCWDGEKVEIQKKWNVLLSGNRPLIIDQTTHQMGLTKDYLVLVETSFKFALENSLPYQTSSLVNDAKILLADFLNYTQFPCTKLYIIKLADLEKTETQKNNIFSFFNRTLDQNLPTVIAKEITLEPEFSHYLVDYDNPDGQITLHASHLAASDIAEVIRVFDRSAFDDRDRDNEEDKYDDPDLSCRVQKLAGSVVGPMDVSRLGCWVINGETGDLVTSQSIDCDRLTWSTAFYAYQDDRPTKEFTDIYWNSWGCWPDLLTIRTVEAYRDYPHRKIPIEEVLKLTYDGVPSSLCHLKIDREEKEKKEKLDLNIVDSYQFPRGYLGTSAQFVPR
ncbi:MAG: carotenoid oxygenase family protein, partial [Xenococcaceae cyanobacterium]